MMNDIEKLKVLLHHFIEHGYEHAKTYEDWEARLRNLGMLENAECFKKAAMLVKEAISELKKVRIEE
jgi:hypothetical protein